MLRFMNDSNFFKCPDCQKMTRHIKMSAIEDNANDRVDSDNLIGKAFAAASDFTGLSKVLFSVIGQPWKCSECGYITERRADGSIINCRGKSKF